VNTTRVSLGAFHATLGRCWSNQLGNGKAITTRSFFFPCAATPARSPGCRIVGSISSRTPRPRQSPSVGWKSSEESMVDGRRVGGFFPGIGTLRPDKAVEHRQVNSGIFLSIHARRHGVNGGPIGLSSAKRGASSDEYRGGPFFVAELLETQAIEKINLRSRPRALPIGDRFFSLDHRKTGPRVSNRHRRWTGPLTIAIPLTATPTRLRKPSRITANDCHSRKFHDAAAPVPAARIRGYPTSALENMRPRMANVRKPASSPARFIHCTAEKRITPMEWYRLSWPSGNVGNWAFSHQLPQPHRQPKPATRPHRGTPLCGR